jgi:hypothetical protein
MESCFCIKIKDCRVVQEEARRDSFLGLWTTLNMEAESSSKTLVTDYQSIRCCILIYKMRKTSIGTTFTERNTCLHSPQTVSENATLGTKAGLNMKRRKCHFVISKHHIMTMQPLHQPTIRTLYHVSITIAST